MHHARHAVISTNTLIETLKVDLEPSRQALSFENMGPFPVETTPPLLPGPLPKSLLYSAWFGPGRLCGFFRAWTGTLVMGPCR